MNYSRFAKKKPSTYFGEENEKKHHCDCCVAANEVEDINGVGVNRVVNWMPIKKNAKNLVIQLTKQLSERHLLDNVKKCWDKALAVDYQGNKFTFIVFWGSCASAIQQIESHTNK